MSRKQKVLARLTAALTATNTDPTPAVDTADSVSSVIRAHCAALDAAIVALYAAADELDAVRPALSRDTVSADGTVPAQATESLNAAVGACEAARDATGRAWGHCTERALLDDSSKHAGKIRQDLRAIHSNDPLYAIDASGVSKLQSAMRQAAAAVFERRRRYTT